MVSPRAPSSPRLNPPVQQYQQQQNKQKEQDKKLISSQEKVISSTRNQLPKTDSNSSSFKMQKRRKTPPKLQQEKKRDNLDNQQIIYTHEAQPKSTPRRLKTKLRKRRSKSQSPSAIHRVERQSIKKMEELRRNAVSSLGNHKEEENLNSDKKKQISPSQVREVKEKIGGGQPKYLEKKISNAERKLKKEHSRLTIPLEDGGVRSLPEE